MKTCLTAVCLVAAVLFAAFATTLQGVGFDTASANVTGSGPAKMETATRLGETVLVLLGLGLMFFEFRCRRSDLRKRETRQAHGWPYLRR